MYAALAGMESIPWVDFCAAALTISIQPKFRIEKNSKTKRETKILHNRHQNRIDIDINSNTVPFDMLVNVEHANNNDRVRFVRVRLCV